MLELRNSKRTYLGKDAQGRNRYALDCSIGAIQYRENGEWVDIDPSIEEADTEGFSVKFAKLPYIGRIGNDSHRRIYPDRTNPDCWIEFHKPFPNMPAPSRHNRWFYWDFTHALMGIRFDNTSIKFGFRLKDSDAPTSITIPFITQGITRQGRFLYHDGQIIAELRKPTAEDTNGEIRACEVSFGFGEVTISLDTTGLAFPIDIDPTLDLQVGASNDDCQRRLATSYFSLTDNNEQAGAYSSTYYGYGCGLRFTGITIPNGATIETAYLKFTARSADTYLPLTRISAEDVDNAGDFSGDDAASFDTRFGNHTTARIDWDNIPAWSVDEEGADTTSPEIKTVIKEIVDRASWASGNAMVLFWEDFDDRSTHHATNHYIRSGYSYDSSTTKCGKLHIEYTSGGVNVTPSPASAIAQVVAPTVVHGSLTLTPSFLAAIARGIDPTVILGSTTATPEYVKAIAGVIPPLVVGEKIVVTPDPVSAIGQVVAPTVVLGSLVITPDEVYAIAQVVAPTVKLGNIIIQNGIAEAIGQVIAPTVIHGSLTLEPEFIEAIARGENPEVILASMTVTPEFVKALAGVVAPYVLQTWIGRKLRVKIVTTQNRQVNVITSQYRKVDVVTSQKRKVRVLTGE